MQAMLRELNCRENRRWFASPDHDLFVWLGANGQITGFQFCYDKRSDERAITWRRGSRTVEHQRVRAGDELPTRNDAPELVGVDSPPPLGRLLAEFRNGSAKIDVGIRDLVVEVLEEASPDALATHP
jgi:hypothetical protein